MSPPFTEHASLPSATAEAFRQLRIDRVVVVGDSTVVSDAVIGQLVAVGVDVTARIGAVSPESMSAAVAELMTTACDSELDAARYLVALAVQAAACDAVSSLTINRLPPRPALPLVVPAKATRRVCGRHECSDILANAASQAWNT